MAYGLSNGHVTDDVTWPPKMLWDSTVGYPSDSLASCFAGGGVVSSYVLGRRPQRAQDAVRRRWRTHGVRDSTATHTRWHPSVAWIPRYNTSPGHSLHTHTDHDKCRLHRWRLNIYWFASAHPNYQTTSLSVVLSFCLNVSFSKCFFPGSSLRNKMLFLHNVLLYGVSKWSSQIMDADLMTSVTT